MMSFGLEVFRSDGSVRLGRADRVARIVLSTSITFGGNSTYYLNVPGFRNDDTWGVFYWSYALGGLEADPQYQTNQSFYAKIENFNVFPEPDRLRFVGNSGLALASVTAYVDVLVFRI